MEKETFNELLRRYEEGRCTPAEAAKVEEWFHAMAKASPEPAGEPDYGKLGKQLYDRIGIPKGRPAKFMRWLPYAAAILVSLAVGIVVYRANQPTSPQLTSQYGDDALPGSNKATLTLADGRVIDLDQARKGIVIGTENITYDDGSTLNVMLSEAEASLQNSRDPSTPLRSAQGDGSVMLALTTPRGGQYQVTLPDGSKAWLNAASTLKYPSRFTANERIVELEGEAYFDIVQTQGTRDTRAPAPISKSIGVPNTLGMPFKVRTSGQTVEVLGTQFNISAYPGSPETQTTLVEGKVQVEANGASLQLVPGEQAATTDKALNKRNVNTESYTGWHEGWFVFHDLNLADIMRQLENWYDIEVDYATLPDENYYGRIKRDVRLSDVLDILAADRNFTFKLNGRTLMAN